MYSSWMRNKQSMREMKFISIRGANVNNLKDLSVEIPRNELVVYTGL